MKYLEEGDKIQVQGSGKKPYDIRKIGGVVDCSCPAWRNLGGTIDTRVCKHIKANVDPACLSVAAQLQKVGATAKPIKAVKAIAPALLLAHTWTDEDPKDWWVSEKLDGVRGKWDGKQFISRLGNVYHAPEWFTEFLPKTVLDGELFIGRKKFQQTVSTVRKLIPVDKEWAFVSFMVFDAPEAKGDFEARMAHLKTIHNQEYKRFLDAKYTQTRRKSYGETFYWKVCSQTKCHGLAHMQELLQRAEARGGEGIMLRQAGSMYEAGRSHTLLKVKTFYDDEAVVLGYEPGKGKHKGRCGSLRVRNTQGIEFDVGTGLTDKEREDPPAIGSVITYRFQELSRDYVPRFPSYLRVRED